jgi:hypothetical protein
MAVDPFTVASFAAPILGGLFGGDNSDEVNEYMNKAMASLEGIVPPDLAKAIVYDLYTQGGTLTPQELSKLPEELQQVVLLKEDPRAIQRVKAQQSALEELAQTGMGAQERFALEQSRLKSAQDFAANLKSIEQQSQQRGLAGSGASLAMQLSAAQQGSQNEAMQNMQAAAMAAENRRGAIAQAMAGAQNLRQQDLAVEQSNVEAKRQRQIFDIQNALARQQANAQMAQQSNIYNLQRQQEVMDRNIQQANQEALRRNYLAPQLMYQNQLGLANSRAKIYGERAGLAQSQGQARAQGIADMFGGISSAALGYGKAQQEARQTDLKGAISGYEWDDDSGKWWKK